MVTLYNVGSWVGEGTCMLLMELPKEGCVDINLLKHSIPKYQLKFFDCGYNYTELVQGMMSWCIISYCLFNNGEFPNDELLTICYNYDSLRP